MKDIKSLLGKLDSLNTTKVLTESEQVSIAPAQSNTQVIKQGDKVVGTVTNPALAAQLKSAIGKGEMSLNNTDNLNQLQETETEYTEGDRVTVTGDVQMSGQSGTVDALGIGGKFVIVKFDDGSKHSFHSSDLSPEEESDEDDDGFGFMAEESSDSTVEDLRKAVKAYKSDLRSMEVGGGSQTRHERVRAKIKELEALIAKKSKNVSEDEMTEVAAPGQEDWIKANKEKFVKQYGKDKGMSVLYATAWKRSKKNESMGDQQEFTDFEQWRDAVVKAYPGKKFKFTGRMEGGKQTISAEIPGEDRSYGVWDQDAENGVVLTELDASTYQRYIDKKKTGPAPKSMSDASKDLLNMRRARELKASKVNKDAKLAQGDARYMKSAVVEGRAKRANTDFSPIGQLKQLNQPVGINGGSYTYWVDVTKTPLKFVASDGSEVKEAKTLKDIAKWMDKWAAEIWLEFLDGVESLDILRAENIIRTKKGRGDQAEHEAGMLEEGPVKDAETALANHAQRKIDKEKKEGPLSAPDLHQHEVIRKQLLSKKRRAMNAKDRKMFESAGANDTLSHILNKFKHEVKQFELGEEIDSDLYDALFDYWADAGEIPYGVAKGRDGDPVQWVSDRLSELLLNETQDEGMNMATPDMQFEAWDRELTTLLNEGLTVSTSTGGASGMEDSVTVSATGSDADEIMQLLKTAGVGHFGSSESEEEQEVSAYGAPINPDVAGHEEFGSDYESEEGSEQPSDEEGDDIMNLIKQMFGGASGDVEVELVGDEGQEAGDSEECCDDETEELGTDDSDEEESGDEDENKEEVDEAYANEPDTSEADLEYITNTVSGGLNKQKRDQTVGNPTKVSVSESDEGGEKKTDIPPAIARAMKAEGFPLTAEGYKKFTTMRKSEPKKEKELDEARKDRRSELRAAGFKWVEDGRPGEGTFTGKGADMDAWMSGVRSAEQLQKMRKDANKEKEPKQGELFQESLADWLKLSGIKK